MLLPDCRREHLEKRTMDVGVPFLVCVALIMARTIAGEVEKSDVAFPLQFSAVVRIIAHLVPVESEYPPRERVLKVDYDYTNKVARADVPKGFEAAKTYFRRYDEKQEYMVRPDPIGDCKRSYLGEVMPFPVIPDTTPAGEETFDGVMCNHYVHMDHDTRLDVYMDKSSGAPVRLVQSSLDSMDGTDQNYSPVLSYMYSDVQLGAPNIDNFDLPSPYTYTSCDNQVGGFPYLHIFHYFVRF